MGEVVPFPTKEKIVNEEEVATITIYSNGRVVGWLSDIVDDHEQAEWTRARLADGVFCVATTLEKVYK